jgi:uncharacterized protein YceK
MPLFCQVSHYPLRYQTDTFFISHPFGTVMELKQYGIILVVIFLVAILTAGCTTTTTVGNPSSGQATPAPAATAAVTPAAVASAAPAATAVPVVSTTPQCPDNSIWGGKWDTRWVSESHDIAPDPNYPGYPWSGQDSPGATPVQITQNKCDVTGSYVPAGNAMGKGTITAKIDGNQLKGSYETTWPSSSDREWGTFTLTMAADNQSWVGYAKSHDRGVYNDPNNWVGRR